MYKHALTQIRILDLQTYQHICTSYYTWLHLTYYLVQYLWLHAELIPANNSVVRDLPATFSCRVTDTTGTLSLIIPEWFINGLPADGIAGPYVVELPPAAPNNANITIVSSFVQLRVTCRIPFHPDVDLGVIQVGE